jgi:formate-dependent phosphoribosylglycinamide formyltransferase (GAR transformylase)
MANVLFVAPVAMETTLRFVRAAASLPGVRLGLLTQEDPKRLPRELLAELQAVERLSDCQDPDKLVAAAQKVAHGWGGKLDRLVGVLEQLQEPLAVARRRLDLPGLSVDAARNFRDKSRMKDVLRAAGLPCAAHLLARTVDEALAFADSCGLPLVVKPPAGAGAKGTFQVSGREELVRYLESARPTPTEPVLLEEFVGGREFSFDSVSIGGRHVFHSISDYFPTPLEVMRTPWIQWCVLLPRDISGPEYAPIREAGPLALSALGMDTGITHLEWFRRPDGSIAISEVAARPPGAHFTTLLSYAHDLDFYRAWAELVIFGRFDPPARRYAAGAAYLKGRGEGRVVAVHGLEAARAELGDVLVETRLPTSGTPAAGGYEGDACILLRHPDTEVVRRGLAEVLKLIEVELGEPEPKKGSTDLETRSRTETP